MKTLIECEMEYLPSPHLMQIYSGFFELQKQGVINLKVKPAKNKKAEPILTVTINKKYKAIYDTLDGLSWIVGDRTQNLKHFQNTYQADFYFKRSYHKQLEQYSPEGCKVLPLGLNYNIHPDYNLFSFNDSLKDKVKYILKTNKLLKPFSSKRFFYARDFEFPPTKHEVDKVLFLTRLWDPAEAKSEASRHHRKQINEVRVACIEACRKEFGDQFTGGISMDSFSSKQFSHLAMPEKFTSKGHYLQSVKQHSICIATTGLHDSIGWKLSEYVAASRAIVSEPLQYELPGNFNVNQNYLEFQSPQEVVEQIKKLLNNKELIWQMMQANHDYYNNYVKPEKLVLNTILQVLQPKEQRSTIQEKHFSVNH